MALMKGTSVEALNSIIGRFREARILVVGDLILDQYIWGKVNRISPEAPIPVVEVVRESVSLGGAANVANNVCALGAQAEVCGVIGEDGYGRALTELLREKKIRTKGVVRDPTRSTTLKTRIVAHRQQVVRVDREIKESVGIPLLNRMIGWIEKTLPRVDGIVLEDYGKGVIQEELLKEIIPLAVKAGKILTVDPKKDNIRHYRGVTAITPNLAEAEAALEMKISDTESLHRAGSRLRKKLGCEAVLITMGERGMCLFERGKPPLQIPAQAREVYDVSGAGDSVIAVFTVALVAGATPRQAAFLSNAGGGIVVEKLGTSTVTVEELKKRLKEE